MPLKFYNIRSKEVRVAESEPMIAALWSSSDRGPNVSQGQDFGWRLAPEVVVELKRIKSNAAKIQEIAVRYNLPLEEVNERTILKYISDKTNINAAPVAEDGDYEDEYRAEVMELEKKARAEEAAAAEEASVGTPVTTQETTESLEDLERRVALEERLAAAKAKNNEPAPTTTTTTTKPVTTTTTTKSK